MVASCHVKDALSAMTMLFSFLEIKKKLKQAIIGGCQNIKMK